MAEKAGLMNAGSFDRVNLAEVATASTVAHDGDGEIRFARLVERAQTEGTCNFVDLAVLPPGASIGRHRHATDEEEYYLVLEGDGTMWRNGDEFDVRQGDLVRNPPGAEHGLRNTGTTDLRLFVFEVQAAEAPR